ncbi:hypothetical protein Ancab_015701 [Ancistrocladus abbreviatus]
MASISRFMMLLLVLITVAASSSMCANGHTTGEPMPPPSDNDVNEVVEYLNVLAKCFVDRVVPAVPGCADELGASFIKGSMQLSEACRNAVASILVECTN